MLFRFRSKPRLLLPTQADSTGPIESAGETLFLAMSSNKSCPQMNQPNSPGGQRLFYTLAISSINWLIITRRDSFRTHLTSFFSKGPKDRLWLVSGHHNPECAFTFSRPLYNACILTLQNSFLNTWTVLGEGFLCHWFSCLVVWEQQPWGFCCGFYQGQPGARPCGPFPRESIWRQSFSWDRAPWDGIIYRTAPWKVYFLPAGKEISQRFWHWYIAVIFQAITWTNWTVRRNFLKWLEGD